MEIVSTSENVSISTLELALHCTFFLSFKHTPIKHLSRNNQIFYEKFWPLNSAEYLELVYEFVLILLEISLARAQTRTSPPFLNIFKES